MRRRIDLVGHSPPVPMWDNLWTLNPFLCHPTPTLLSMTLSSLSLSSLLSLLLSSLWLSSLLPLLLSSLLSSLLPSLSLPLALRMEQKHGGEAVPHVGRFGDRHQSSGVRTWWL